MLRCNIALAARGANSQFFGRWNGAKSQLAFTTIPQSYEIWAF
jgi:hypothetical protein